MELERPPLEPCDRRGGCVWPILVGSMLVNWYADIESYLGFMELGGERGPKSTGFADASDALLRRDVGKIGVLYESVGDVCVLCGSMGDRGPAKLGSPTSNVPDGFLDDPLSRSSMLR